jgi:DNA replication protein DnaC
LGRLGWSLRRIEQSTRVRREIAGDYLRVAGIALRRPGGWGRQGPSKPAIGPIIQQGYRVLYREAHRLLEELADATLDGKRKELMEQLTTVPLLIIDDLGMRKLPLTAAEELLEIIMRRYERASTLLTSNGPVEDRGETSSHIQPKTSVKGLISHSGNQIISAFSMPVRR